MGGTLFFMMLVTGIGVVCLTIVFITKENRASKELVKATDNRKDELLSIIDDAELMVDELNNFSDYIIGQIEKKNSEIDQQLTKLDEKLKKAAEAQVRLDISGVRYKSIKSHDGNNSDSNPWDVDHQDEYYWSVKSGDIERRRAERRDIDTDTDTDEVDASDIKQHDADPRETYRLETEQREAEHGEANQSEAEHGEAEHGEAEQSKTGSLEIDRHETDMRETDQRTAEIAPQSLNEQDGKHHNSIRKYNGKRLNNKSVYRVERSNKDFDFAGKAQKGKPVYDVKVLDEKETLENNVKTAVLTINEKKYGNILKYAENGMSKAKIAKELGIGKGEVELILGLKSYYEKP